LLAEFSEKAIIAGDKDYRKLRDQIECGLDLHLCISTGKHNQGHLFQFVRKLFQDNKAGHFKCKFCSITTTRLMTADELKAADKLALGN